MLYLCHRPRPSLISRLLNIVKRADFFIPLEAHLGCGTPISSEVLAGCISSTTAISCSSSMMSRYSIGSSKRCRRGTEGSKTDRLESFQLVKNPHYAHQNAFMPRKVVT